MNHFVVQFLVAKEELPCVLDQRPIYNPLGVAG